MAPPSLQVVSVEPDHVDRDIADLRGALERALEGGPAIAPLPVATPSIPDAVVARLRAAVAPEHPLEDAQTCAVIPTSGSTGDPLGVCHSASSLLAAADSFDRAYPELRGAPWILALPPTSAAGFAVVLRATVAGADLQVLDSIAGVARFTPADFAAAVEASSGATPVVSLVPRQLAVLLEDGAGAAALASCGLVLVGGGPTPAPLRARAEAAGARLRTTYGMTETCGGVVHDGRALPDVSISIEEATEQDAEQHIANAPPGPSGPIRISGPMVALGYRRRPRETARAFRPGSILTRDLGRWTDGRLTVLGRLDDAVKVKGITVSLPAVEDAARDVPGVLDAVAAIVDPVVGDSSDEPMLALAVVASPDAAATLAADVVAHIGRRLGAAARPRVIEQVPGLPLLPGGKIDRHAVARILGERTDAPKG